MLKEYTLEEKEEREEESDQEKGAFDQKRWKDEERISKPGTTRNFLCQNQMREQQNCVFIEFKFTVVL